MKKKYWYSVGVTLLLALVAVLFFYPDDLQGNVLQQHDIMQGLANSHEGQVFQESTGETTRWTNSLFGGMPNFQIAPKYPAGELLTWVGNALMLWLPAPAGLLFVMMFGFFLMCLCMRFKWYTSLFASLAWGLSTYFIIIIGAGHIWKFVTLAYIPPTIGGLVLLYRRKWLAGFAMTALFGAMQLHSNHPQMTYYFLFVVAALVLAWLWEAAREKRVGSWLAATGLALLAGGTALAANSASLYNTYEYSKETVRGRATDLKAKGGDETGGMSREAITAWSYGLDESFSLLIPNVKGGATIKPNPNEQSSFLSVVETPQADEESLSAQEMQILYQFPQYFGNQPMTNGPVYVGAFVLLLALLGLFVVKGPVKWALFGVSVLALMLSWGHNFPLLTNAFIDWMPAYNKFRAPASMLVVVEFCVPLLAAMCVALMVKDREAFTRNPWTLRTVFGLGTLVALAGVITPGIFGSPFSVQETEMLAEQGLLNNPAYATLLKSLGDIRLGMVRADALRSLVFILIGWGIVWLWLSGKLKSKPVFGCLLSLLVVCDLFPVDRRYVDSDNFTTPSDPEEMFEMTDADRAILKDTTNYRVLDVNGMGSARSSYFHKTIGGYHAAKLTRYNDLLEKQISKSNMGVLNMLNTKYVLAGDQYQENPAALGNAWFAERISYVPDADSEMAALDTLDTAHGAVADRKFRDILGAAGPKSEGDTIYETSYAPNRLSYRYRSAKGGVAVFSEIYFPWGWEAEIDGKPVEIGRVNYVLRAAKVPAGEHGIVFRFDPKSLRVTNTVSMVAAVFIYVICAGAAALWAVRTFRRNRKE